MTSVPFALGRYNTILTAHVEQWQAHKTEYDEAHRIVASKKREAEHAEPNPSPSPSPNPSPSPSPSPSPNPNPNPNPNQAEHAEQLLAAEQSTCAKQARAE